MGSSPTSQARVFWRSGPRPKAGSGACLRAPRVGNAVHVTYSVPRREACNVAAVRRRSGRRTRRGCAGPGSDAGLHSNHPAALRGVLRAGAAGGSRREGRQVASPKYRLREPSGARYSALVLGRRHLALFLPERPRTRAVPRQALDPTAPGFHAPDAPPDRPGSPPRLFVADHRERGARAFVAGAA